MYTCMLNVEKKNLLKIQNVHGMAHGLITKSLVGKQTSQNSFMSAKATNAVSNTFELSDFNMLKIYQCMDSWCQRKGDGRGKTSP